MDLIKKTPEGLVYLSKTLITNRMFEKYILEFYDYIRVVLLIDSDNYEKNKKEINQYKEKIKPIELFVALKNSKKIDVAIYDVENQTNLLPIIRRANLIYNLEKNEKKDKLNVVASNFNQVYAKEFYARNIVLGISIDSFNNSMLITRVRQNLKIARKFKVPVVLSLFESENDIFGWFEAMNLLRTLL